MQKKSDGCCFLPQTVSFDGPSITFQERKKKTFYPICVLITKKTFFLQEKKLKLKILTEEELMEGAV
jgi:hypothetical protein